jgi:hypothetical protein
MHASGCFDLISFFFGVFCAEDNFLAGDVGKGRGSVRGWYIGCLQWHEV